MRGSCKELKGVEQREEEILGDAQISEIQVTINGLLNNMSPGICHGVDSNVCNCWISKI